MYNKLIIIFIDKSKKNMTYCISEASDMTDEPSDGIELRRMFKMLNFS